jgi:hypothetical protein
MDRHAVRAVGSLAGRNSDPGGELVTDSCQRQHPQPQPRVSSESGARSRTRRVRRRLSVSQLSNDVHGNFSCHGPPSQASTSSAILLYRSFMDRGAGREGRGHHAPFFLRRADEFLSYRHRTRSVMRCRGTKLGRSHLAHLLARLGALAADLRALLHPRVVHLLA